MSEHRDAVELVLDELQAGLLTRDDAIRKLKFLGLSTKEILNEIGPPETHAE